MNKERKEKFLTSSQIEVKSVYTAKDLLDFSPPKSQSLPGEFPFTRGIYPNMYRGNCGLCANMLVLQPLKNPTKGTASFFHRVRQA
jgi:methylmalonyl-CoA mutase N-terminal domain/subunit